MSPAPNTLDIIKTIKPTVIKLDGLSGSSMYPTLMHKDRVHLEYTSSKRKLQDQDIVLIESEMGRMLLHRYFASQARTKGDSSAFFDKETFTPIARVRRIKHSWLYPLRRFKFRLAHSVPTEIQIFCKMIAQGNAADIDFSLCDKTFLLKWLKRHSLRPLFAHFVETSETASPISSEELQKQTQNAILTEQIREQAQKTVSSLLAQSNIPYAAIKGLWSSQTLYEEPWLRQMVDLDIMIEKCHCEKLLGALELKPSIEVLNPKLKNQQHIQLILKDLFRFPIDVHWRYRYMNYEANFETDLQKKWATRNGHEIVYTPEFHLCLIIASFFSSNEGAFRPLIDALLLLQKYNLDWTKFDNIAEDLKITKRVRRFNAIFERFWPNRWPSSEKCSPLERLALGIYGLNLTKPQKEPRIFKVLMRGLLFESFQEFLSYGIERMRFQIRKLKY